MHIVGTSRKNVFVATLAAAAAWFAVSDAFAYSESTGQIYSPKAAKYTEQAPVTPANGTAVSSDSEEGRAPATAVPVQSVKKDTSRILVRDK